MQVQVPGFRLQYDESFIKDAEVSLRRVLESGWTSEGPEVRKFEQAFGALCPAKHKIATTSCTMALDLALRAIGVKGRQVIVPTNTFYATALAVVNAGAEVELVDVCVETFALCPIALKQALASNIQDTVAAVILVHVGGTIGVHSWQIKEICKQWKVPLIEDAAQAHGARTSDGLAAGCIGAIGCFSFFATKVMTTGEGGMLVTNDDDLAERLKNLKNFGRAGGQSAADIACQSSDGLNGRVPEVVGMLGALECKRALPRISKRQELVAAYAEALANEPLFEVLNPPRGESSCYKVIVRLLGGLSRQVIRDGCKQRGIELSGEVWATPVHRHPAFEVLKPLRSRTSAFLCIRNSLRLT